MRTHEKQSIGKISYRLLPYCSKGKLKGPKRRHSDLRYLRSDCEMHFTSRRMYLKQITFCYDVLEEHSADNFF